jgi:molybdopterin synthase catalytic subunit
MSEAVAVRLHPAPLDGAWARACVAGEDAGCVLLFLGTVRAQAADGRRVLRLEYEAYEPMASTELRAIADAVRVRHGLLRVAIEHAIGAVPAGAASVAVAVAAAHRRTVFAAAGEAMDALKTRAPLWKRECYEDGSAWLGQGS